MNIRYISIHTKIHITFKYDCDHILIRNKKIKNKTKVKKQIGGNNHDLQQKNGIKRYKMQSIFPGFNKFLCQPINFK